MNCVLPGQWLICIACTDALHCRRTTPDLALQRHACRWCNTLKSGDNFADQDDDEDNWCRQCELQRQFRTMPCKICHKHIACSNFARKAQQLYREDDADTFPTCDKCQPRPTNSLVRCAKYLKNAMLSTAWAVWHPAVFTFAAKHVMNARCVASCTEMRDISSRTSNSARNVRCTNVMSASNPRLAPFLTKCTYTIRDTLSEICAASLVRFAPSARYQSL